MGDEPEAPASAVNDQTTDSVAGILAALAPASLPGLAVQAMAQAAAIAMTAGVQARSCDRQVALAAVTMVCRGLNGITFQPAKPGGPSTT